MQEYVGEAIVLESYPSGELDTRFSLYTKKFGRVVARAKSIRKIQSKLAGHLQIGNLVRLRLVETKGLQVVDALKMRALAVPPVTLRTFDRLLPEAEPDGELWELLLQGGFSWKEVLAILGWDPLEAACGVCSATSPAFFNVKTQEFFCSKCASKLRQNEVISMDAGSSH